MLRTRVFLNSELAEKGHEPFTSLHPSLGETCLPIAGPFTDAGTGKKACNHWAHDKHAQPDGPFNVIINGAYPGNKVRGPQFKLRCSNCHTRKLGCPFQLVYEQVDDGKFYLVSAKLEHHSECRSPTRTAAESLARGNSYIDGDLLDFGVRLKSTGMTTGRVQDVLFFESRRDNIPITWTWHHLDRALTKALPDCKVNDMAGVLRWLCQQQDRHGLPYHINTDVHDRVNMIFYTVEGSQQVWDRCSGMRLAFFDTTHSMNAYGMKVGCVTTIDQDGKLALLAVSILKREDGRSFRWVFDRLKESFGSEPDVLLTDGDLAMAAAAGLSLANCAHLLCIWHLQENLLTHAKRLFPPRGSNPDKNTKPRDEFMQAIKDIMSKGGPGIESAEEYFEKQWQRVIDKALAEGALPRPAPTTRPPPPPSTSAPASDGSPPPPPPSSATQDEPPGTAAAPRDGDAADPAADISEDASEPLPRSLEDAYDSAAEEAEMEDEDALEHKLEQRAKINMRKSPATLVWEWLEHLKGLKKKWACVFTREHPTRGSKASSVAESWHAAIKRDTGVHRRLLDMIIHIENRRANMSTRKAQKTAHRKEVQESKAAGFPVMLDHLLKKITPAAMDDLLAAHKQVSTYLCRDIPNEDGVVDAWRVGPKGKGFSSNAVIATTQTCSAMCHMNMGLPCVHILRVAQHLNMEELSLDLISPFWREGEWKGGGEIVGDDEEEPAAMVEPEPVVDTPVAMDCDEVRDVDGFRPDERWHAIQGKWKHLKELGTRSKAACKDVMDGIDELLERLDLKHSVFDDSGDSGAIDPSTGRRVLNPVKPKKSKGRPGQKRKKGPRG